MKLLKIHFVIILILLLNPSSLFSLTMSNNVIEHFKKTVQECCEDALEIRGEYKNNGYYVSLRDGIVKGYSFNNVKVKFENVNENIRKDLLNTGVSFFALQSKCKIKVAADISPFEFQQIINNEIGRSSTAKRIFNKAEFDFESNAVVVNGSLNMKRVPGNPFAMISNDEFSPFRVRISANMVGSKIYLSIIDGTINGEEMSPELKNVFLNWLNPLWDFSKLDFNCEINEYKITPSGLRIVGTVF